MSLLYLLNERIGCVRFALLGFKPFLMFNLILFFSLTIDASPAAGEDYKAHAQDEEVDRHHVLNPRLVICGVRDGAEEETVE